MELTNTPIFRMYKLTISKDYREKFIEEGKHNLTTSIQNEPGTLAMYSSHEDKEGTTNYIFEIYQDIEHYQIHANSPQFKSYGEVAKQVLTGREIFELTPEFLFIDQGYQVSGLNNFVVQLYDFTIDESKVKHIKHLLDEELVSSYDIAKGIATFHAAALNAEGTHWIFLVIYKDQAVVNVAGNRVKELLADTDAAFDFHNLTLDIMVSHETLQFSALEQK